MVFNEDLFIVLFYEFKVLAFLFVIAEVHYRLTCINIQYGMRHCVIVIYIFKLQ